jgi:Arc/MetJ family transcription regulator
MTERLVEIDDQLLARAQAILGEGTVGETVTAALKKLTNDELIQDHIDFLRNADFDPAILDEIRDPWKRFPGGRPPDDDE